MSLAGKTDGYEGRKRPCEPRMREEVRALGDLGVRATLALRLLGDAVMRERVSQRD